MQDVDDLYAAARELKQILESNQNHEFAAAIDQAMTSGTTSGEILGDLWIALDSMHLEGDAESIRTDCMVFIESALGPAKR